MATSRLSLTLCWPMYSPSTRGRSDNSNVASSSIIDPAITRSDTPLSFCQNLQRPFEQDLESRLTIAIHRTAQCAFGQCAVVAEVLQRGQDIDSHARLRLGFCKILQLIFQLQNDSLARLSAHKIGRASCR